MIEIILELKLDSLLVNSIGGASDSLDYMPSKALRFSCEKIASSRPLADNTPGEDFDFLNTSIKHELKAGGDKEFDDQFVKFLTINNVIDTSRVVIAPEPSDNRKKPEGVSSIEIGRIFFTKLPDQKSHDLKMELFLKRDEFEEVWKMTAQQNIRNVITTLACFKLKQEAPGAQKESALVAGVFSSSLRMVPNL